MALQEIDDAVAGHLAAGDCDAAATALVRGLGPHVLGYLRGVLRDEDDADDAFARWAESVWIGIGGFRGDASLKTWCYRIAWHAALRILRDPHQQRRRPLTTGRAAGLVQEVRTATASHLGSTAQGRVAALRRKLTSEDQNLLILRLDRGLAWRDIALILAEEGLEVSEAALRKRYERIKNRVRELAIESGLLPESGSQ